MPFDAADPEAFRFAIRFSDISILPDPETTIAVEDKIPEVKILFDEVSRDSRFDSINSSYIVKKILEREKGSDLGKQISNWITEIYNEKAKEDKFYKNYMSFLISRLDN